MADSTIGGLPAAGALAGANLLEIVQGGAGKQTTLTAIANYITALIVDGSPGALDTLNELAAALGDDANYAATITAALAAKQPLDTDLTAIAALTSAADKGIHATGAGTWSVHDLTAFARTILDDANAAAALTTLGIAFASQAEAEAGADTTKYMNPLRVAQAIAALGGSGAGFFAQPRPVGRPFTIVARDWDNVTPGASELHAPGWLVLGTQLVNPDIIVMVTTAAAGAGGAIHAGLIDEAGDVVASTTVDATAINKRSSVLTGTFPAGLYIPFVQRIGTYATTQPILRGAQAPAMGICDRYEAFSDATQAGHGRGGVLTGQGSVPASVDLATLPISGGDYVACAWLEPN